MYVGRVKKKQTICYVLKSANVICELWGTSLERADAELKDSGIKQLVSSVLSGHCICSKTQYFSSAVKSQIKYKTE
ncbi:hypothetical protein XELAEV_18027160mg [Xenopus laevis]|uniref:Uncharacterized protein n=1 Tax=Xenopus laevis TaxID=8355 RepID=A0A974CX38_XENLA|nr:hypothetical protein XELAEV_18027160mg [Xenopus laevis]